MAIIRALKWLILIFLVVFITFTILVVELSPNVEKTSSQQLDDAESVTALLNQLRSVVRERDTEQSIPITHAQANSLAGFLQRAVKEAVAAVDYQNNKVVVRASYKVDAKVFPVFINVKAEIHEGKGLVVDNLSVGDLPLGGDMALKMAAYLANKYTNSNIANEAIDAVASIEINEDVATLNVNPIQGVIDELKNVDTGKDPKESLQLRLSVAHYLRLLNTLEHNRVQPLSYYMQHVFEHAVKRSEQSTPELENEAAILAIAIFTGNTKFSRLVGDFRFAFNNIPYAKRKPLLKSRTDLSLHFVYSAAIKILSRKGISIAMGEFKELMDRARGGSGYSFVDLAADLSGAHFAEVALDPSSAARVQQIMRSLNDENIFMVPINGLQEGLSKAEFTEQYERVDSPQYLAVVNDIRRRIQDLAISKNSF